MGRRALSDSFLIRRGGAWSTLVTGVWVSAVMVAAVVVAAVVVWEKESAEVLMRLAGGEEAVGSVVPVVIGVMVAKKCLNVVVVWETIEREKEERERRRRATNIDLLLREGGGGNAAVSMVGRQHCGRKSKSSARAECKRVG